MSEEPITPKKVEMPDIRIFKIDKLVKAKTNVRESYPEKAMQTLEASISAVGLQELPKATSKGEVISGWARVEACRTVGIEELPVIIVDNLTEVEQIVASLAENYARHKLLDDEVKSVLRNLQTKEGMSIREISKKTGIDRGVVGAILAFYDLPSSTQNKFTQVGSHTLPVIRQALDEGEKQGFGREEIAEQIGSFTGSTSPSGQPVVRAETMQAIVEQAKKGRNVQQAIQDELNKVKSEDYRTISFAVPDSIYTPVSKYAQKKKMTIQEVFFYAIKKIMDEIKTEISTL
jgi:ParB/RepB/Spo0J family partition protein